MKVPDFNKMDKDQIYDWVQRQQEVLSEDDFKKLINACQPNLNQRMSRLDRMRDAVIRYYSELNDLDMGVAEFFDVESDRMMDKKLRVLKALHDGKSPEEIGKDYLDILEKYDPSQGPVKIEGWTLNPKDFK